VIEDRLLVGQQPVVLGTEIRTGDRTTAALASKRWPSSTTRWSSSWSRASRPRWRSASASLSSITSISGS